VGRQRLHLHPQEQRQHVRRRHSSLIPHRLMIRSLLCFSLYLFVLWGPRKLANWTRAPKAAPWLSMENTYMRRLENNIVLKNDVCVVESYLATVIFWIRPSPHVFFFIAASFLHKESLLRFFFEGYACNMQYWGTGLCCDLFINLFLVFINFSSNFLTAYISHTGV